MTGVKREQDSGRKDALGRRVMVSGNEAEQRASAPRPPAAHPSGASGAARHALALATYRHLPALGIDADPAGEGREDSVSQIADVVSNFMHYLELKYGEDAVSEMLAYAEQHWEDERGGGDDFSNDPYYDDVAIPELEAPEPDLPAGADTLAAISMGADDHDDLVPLADAVKAAGWPGARLLRIESETDYSRDEDGPTWTLAVSSDVSDPATAIREAALDAAREANDLSDLSDDDADELVRDIARDLAGSLTEALESIPPDVLARHGLMRVEHVDPFETVSENDFRYFGVD